MKASSEKVKNPFLGESLILKFMTQGVEKSAFSGAIDQRLW